MPRKKPQPEFTIAESSEVQRREREIKLILNVIEPDSEYQPFIVTDESTAFDVSANSTEEVEQRLRNYFGADANIELQLPLWKLVDSLKRQYPGWPDEWPTVVN